MGQPARRTVRGLVRQIPLPYFWICRDNAVILLRQRTELLGSDVPCNHQYGIVGRIEATIEGQRIIKIQALDFLFPADDGNAVGCAR